MGKGEGFAFAGITRKGPSIGEKRRSSSDGHSHLCLQTHLTGQQVPQEDDETPSSSRAPAGPQAPVRGSARWEHSSCSGHLGIQHVLMVQEKPSVLPAL